MWAKIITFKRSKDLNCFSLCALNLFNARVSQFELNYWNKWTFPRHSNLLRCTCKHPPWTLPKCACSLGKEVKYIYTCSGYICNCWKKLWSRNWFLEIQQRANTKLTTVATVRVPTRFGKVWNLIEIMSANVLKKKAEYDIFFCCIFRLFPLFSFL